MKSIEVVRMSNKEFVVTKAPTHGSGRGTAK